MAKNKFLPTTQRRLAGSAEGSSANSLPVDSEKAMEIVDVLAGYAHEGEEARKGGPNPRDEKWEENLALYWNRYNFDEKASWQSKERMPEVPVFVDRFAAAMKEALIQSPESFYTVVDPSDQERDVAASIKRMMDVWLSTSGRNLSGSPLGFTAVFEDQIKLGALMAMSSTVSWKRDHGKGRVAIEHVDPRHVWFDNTTRELYRRRRIPIDRHELEYMVKAKDKGGKAIFNLPEIERLVAYMEEEERPQREALTGGGEETMSNRVPLVLDEYLATVVNSDGKASGGKKLYVVANNEFLIRGPEENPYWHKKDWLVYTPLIPVPLSVYGRSYMEDLGDIAKTFVELTNLILDAVKTTAMKNIAIVPEALVNPAQALEGWAPGKTWLLEGGINPKQFAEALDLGTLPPDVIRVWDSMKNELREASMMNEIGLGQFAPNARTSATEIQETKQSSAAMVRSVAQTVETRYLEPTLDLVWKTGIQHVKLDDRLIEAAAGKELFASMMSHRKELASRPITFQARGISTLLQRSQQLKSLLAILQVIAQNDMLIQKLLEKIDINRLIDTLFLWGGVDIKAIQTTEREKLIKGIVQPLEEAAARSQKAPGQPGPGADAAVGGIASILGAQVT